MGTSIAGVYENPPRSGSTNQICRAHYRPIRQGDCLAFVQLSPQRAFRNSQLPGALRIEPAQPRVLHQGVAHRVRPVLSLEDDDVVLVTSQTITRVDLQDF